MLTYQTTKFMTNLLSRKYRSFSSRVARLNDGHSLHVNSDSDEDHFGGTGSHITLCVTLFEDNDIVKSWDFMAHEDAGHLQYTLDDLSFHIRRL